MSRVLIVGGDGLIGAALVPALRTAGHDVTATSYRAPLPKGAVYLDLADADPGVVSGFDSVILAAAVVRRANCEADPERAHRINVDAPLALGSAALAAGAQVIFISTSIVLGGDHPALAVDAPYAPFDAYSRQKAEAEQRLMALPGAGDGLAVLRLTKVLDASYGVVAAWCNAAERGAPITPFTDLVTAPITIPHVTDRIAALVGGRLTGIHHLSGIEHSYAEIAARLGALLDWPPHLITAVEGRKIDPVAALNPAHSSLQANQPMALETVLEALAAQLAKASP